MSGLAGVRFGADASVSREKSKDAKHRDKDKKKKKHKKKESSDDRAARKLKKLEKHTKSKGAKAADSSASDSDGGDPDAFLAELDASVALKGRSGVNWDLEDPAKGHKPVAAKPRGASSDQIVDDDDPDDERDGDQAAASAPRFAAFVSSASAKRGQTSTAAPPKATAAAAPTASGGNGTASVSSLPREGWMTGVGLESDSMIAEREAKRAQQAASAREEEQLQAAAAAIRARGGIMPSKSALAAAAAAAVAASSTEAGSSPDGTGAISAAAAVAPVSTSTAAVTVADGGRSWRLKALYRLKERAQQEGKEFAVLIQQQYGPKAAELMAEMQREDDKKSHRDISRNGNQSSSQVDHARHRDRGDRRHDDRQRARSRSRSRSPRRDHRDKDRHHSNSSRDEAGSRASTGADDAATTDRYGRALPADRDSTHTRTTAPSNDRDARFRQQLRAQTASSSSAASASTGHESRSRGADEDFSWRGGSRSGGRSTDRDHGDRDRRDDDRRSTRDDHRDRERHHRDPPERADRGSGDKHEHADRARSSAGGSAVDGDGAARQTGEVATNVSSTAAAAAPPVSAKPIDPALVERRRLAAEQRQRDAEQKAAELADFLYAKKPSPSPEEPVIMSVQPASSVIPDATVGAAVNSAPVDINKLAARALKAKVMGDMALHDKLQAELAMARVAAASAPSPPTQSPTVTVPRPAPRANAATGGTAPPERRVEVIEDLDRQGAPRTLAAQLEHKQKVVRGGEVEAAKANWPQPSFQRKRKKPDKMQAGERHAYFDADMKDATVSTAGTAAAAAGSTEPADGSAVGADVRLMLQMERLKGVPDYDANQARSIARKAGYRVQDTDAQFDMADISMEDFEDKRSKLDDVKKAQFDRQRAITDHTKMTSELERCMLCLANPRRASLSHLTMATGLKVYLALPTHARVTEGHCMLVPIEHVGAQTDMDENVIEEIQYFRKQLIKMFKKQNKGVLFLETVMSGKQKKHTVIDCIPLPMDLFDDAKGYFQKAITEADEEWSVNKKLVDTTDRGVHRSVPAGFPYFAVDFGEDGGYAHVIEDESLFPKDFGKETVCGMLGEPAQFVLRAKRAPAHVEQEWAKKFAAQWAPFDWTYKLNPQAKAEREAKVAAARSAKRARCDEPQPQAAGDEPVRPLFAAPGSPSQPADMDVA